MIKQKSQNYPGDIRRNTFKQRFTMFVTKAFPGRALKGVLIVF